MTKKAKADVAASHKMTLVFIVVAALVVLALGYYLYTLNFGPAREAGMFPLQNV